MLKKLIEQYQPKNIQEETDKQAMLQFLSRNNDYLVRDNLIGHVTSSAIIVNKDVSKVLFVHHNIYNSWSWVGGHNDGDEDCLFVAIKEAKEETGLEEVTPLSEDIAGIDIVYVPPHIRRGVHVSDHVHLNVTYILVADENHSVQVKEDENSGVRWFDFEELENYVSEPRMIPIYKKFLKVAKSYV